MSFSFSGKHMNIGASLTHHAAEQFDNVSVKYCCEFIDVSVVMEKASFLYITDLSVRVGNGYEFHAKSEAKEPYQSFDSALQKIVSQLKKQRSITNDMNTDSIRHAYDIDAAPGNQHCNVVSETVETVIMSPNEAINLLVSSGNTLIVFRNTFTDDINIVYKRPDGVICLVRYR